MEFRKKLKQSDSAFVREILASSHFFYDYELDVAEELVQENLIKGQEKSGYIFIIAEKSKIPVGFVCYGKTPCTADSFDLYWIGVHQNQKGNGIGKTLMHLLEEDIADLGGKNIWIETSSRPLYEPTRMFYLKTGYEMIAQLPNFYGKNDDKLIFLKIV
ncbi:MAG: GNAT family N-acetyltransferase [Proteobacteria bacterium]|nr:GNAT family N-acetyltransferase [Pseudomonadota bacterium]MBU1581515.1 GNAT family N-acetyltransferase [Pseudomonadota bacterium]MBU2454614.1 GNAT family N-acetyltransferase [Pseudomonadota bacterium]MBU2628073.1 GNAT family N-acetyltransferase [Pseudomonadota bacterium]